eukprot:scaffold90884_cov54-Phaeocystis_antarctica.AAC.2
MLLQSGVVDGGMARCEAGLPTVVQNGQNREHQLTDTGQDSANRLRIRVKRGPVSCLIAPNENGENNENGGVRGENVCKKARALSAFLAP